LAVKPIDTSKGIIRSLRGIAIQHAKELILAQVIKALPWAFGKWLGWLISPALSALLDALLGFLIDKTVLGLSLIYIGVDVQYDVKSAEDVEKKLKDILANQEKYTAAQIKEAEENFDEESIDLIRIGLSRVN
jgi:hypothetical protein